MKIFSKSHKTCDESQIRFTATIKFLWESIESLYRRYRPVLQESFLDIYRTFLRKSIPKFVYYKKTPTFADAF